MSPSGGIMEIELKYLVKEPIARERILKDRHLSEIKEKGSDEEIVMRAVYYDTADLDLSRNEIAFRVRLENGRPIATVKWGGDVSEGLHVRGEFNMPLPDAGKNVPSVDIFRESDIYEKLKDAAEGKPLTELMRVDCVRKQFKVDTGRSLNVVSLDIGEIITGNGSAPVAELEIELYSGDKDDMIALGRELASKYNLEPGNKSKFRIGLELLGKA